MPIFKSWNFLRLPLIPSIRKIHGRKNSNPVKNRRRRRLRSRDQRTGDYRPFWVGWWWRLVIPYGLKRRLGPHLKFEIYSNRLGYVCGKTHPTLANAAKNPSPNFRLNFLPVDSFPPNFLVVLQEGPDLGLQVNNHRATYSAFRPPFHPGMVVWATHVSSPPDLCSLGVTRGADRCEGAACETLGQRAAIVPGGDGWLQEMEDSTDNKNSEDVKCCSFLVEEHHKHQIHSKLVCGIFLYLFVQGWGCLHSKDPDQEVVDHKTRDDGL